MRCGLLGRKLGHSYSPQIHKYLGDYSYTLFEQEPDELKDFFEKKEFDGINVTIPYKKDVIAYCDRLSETAQNLGSVNTIVKQKDGSLIGHNTDYFGFLSMVERSGLDVANKKVLVLGSGGASVTVLAVLRELGANTVVISRTGLNNYGNLHLHKDAAVIVNTTPVGMYPNNGFSAIELDGFPKLEGVLDLIYNPSKTKLLLDAQERGLRWENGLWMLVAQAKESAQWFTGSSIPDNKIQQIHRDLSSEMKNIVLIGMPGCGKSTIGKLLAKKLNKTFVDSDTEIEAAAGCPIPEIFQNQGEDGFRALETAALAKLGMQSARVIATGGGCVTRPENLPLLQQNGRIVWIKRDISALPTDGRPLSQTTSLEKMYQLREPLYRSFSDITTENNESAETTVQKIIQQLEEWI